MPGDPTGALLGPLGLLALVYGRKKKGSKVGMLLALLLVGLSVGMTLSACNNGANNGTGQQPIQTSNQNPNQTGSGTDTGNGASDPGSGTQTPTVTCTFTPTPTPTGTPTQTPIPIPTSSIILYGRAADIRDWAKDIGISTIEVLAVLLNREALNPSREDSRWFATRDATDPAEIYKEAATRWYWSWIKDSWVINRYGRALNDVDREAMVYQWIVSAMQSEDGWTRDILQSQYNELNPEFVDIAAAVLDPLNPEWARGDGMWSWANAYLYLPKGRQILEQHHRYAWGFGETKWYIFDADTVRKVEPYKDPNK